MSVRVCIRKSDNRIIEAQSGGCECDYNLDAMVLEATMQHRGKRINKKRIQKKISDEIKERITYNKEVLIQNAAATGLPTNDLEVIEMDDAEFNKAFAEQSEREFPRPKTAKQKLTHMLAQHGITVKELKAALK